MKVVCKYRAELFFKISRKTKLSRLFTAWSDRMENNALAALRKAGVPVGGSQVNGTSAGKGSDTASIHSNSSTSTNGVPPLPMSFLYTHQGKGLDPEMTVEDAGIEDADEILAVELMDLTGPVPDDVVRSPLFMRLFNFIVDITRRNLSSSSVRNYGRTGRITRQSKPDASMARSRTSHTIFQSKASHGRDF